MSKLYLVILVYDSPKLLVLSFVCIPILHSLLNFRKMNNFTCIIHYKNQSSYSSVKPLSDIKIQRIRDARKKREDIGGSYLHLDQILQIPEIINKEIHGIHLEPCYKRYVNHYICDCNLQNNTLKLLGFLVFGNNVKFSGFIIIFVKALSWVTFTSI